MLIMDFKEKIALNKGPVELGTSYFDHQTCLMLNITVISISLTGERKKTYYNFLRQTGSQDAQYVQSSIDTVLKRDEIQALQLKKLIFWSDNARSQFKNKYMLGYYTQLADSYELKLSTNSISPETRMGRGCCL